MKDDYENIPNRHRFGGEPVKHEFNWLLIAAVVFLCAFWAWVGYSVSRWVP